MTTNLNRSQSKTRDRHASDATRRSTRPTAGGAGKEDTSGLDASSSMSRSADEIRETVKEAVGKGVAAVAGAVEGIDETMQETQLADTAESAVRQVGGTANKVVRAAKEETKNLKEALKGDSGSSESSGEVEDDWGTERDDPTFDSDTESNTSGSPLTYGAGEDDETKPF